MPLMIHSPPALLNAAVLASHHRNGIPVPSCPSIHGPDVACPEHNACQPAWLEPMGLEARVLEWAVDLAGAPVAGLGAQASRLAGQAHSVVWR